MTVEKKSTVSGTRKHKRRFSAKSRQPRAEQRNDGKNTNLNWANFQRWPPSSSGSLNGRLQPGGTLEGLNVGKTSLPLFLFLCWFPRQLRDSLFRILGSTERDLRPLRSAIRLSFQFFSSASPQLLLLLLDQPAENKHTKKKNGNDSSKIVADSTRRICLLSIKTRRFQIRYRIWNLPQRRIVM